MCAHVCVFVAEATRIREVLHYCRLGPRSSVVCVNKAGGGWGERCNGQERDRQATTGGEENSCVEMCKRLHPYTFIKE